MNTDMNDIQLGEITLTQLLDAQKTVASVLEFINENKDSADYEKKELARMALMTVAMNDMFTHPIIANFAREEAEKIKNEHILESKETGPTFSIPIRPASDKS